MENAVLNWPLYGGVHGKKYTMSLMSYSVKIQSNQAPKVHKTTLYLKYMNYIVAVNVNGSSLHEKLRVIVCGSQPKCACMSACDDMLVIVLIYYGHRSTCESNVTEQSYLSQLLLGAVEIAECH